MPAREKCAVEGGWGGGFQVGENPKNADSIVQRGGPSKRRVVPALKANSLHWIGRACANYIRKKPQKTHISVSVELESLTLGRPWWDFMRIVRRSPFQNLEYNICRGSAVWDLHDWAAVWNKNDSGVAIIYYRQKEAPLLPLLYCKRGGSEKVRQWVIWPMSKASYSTPC